MRLATILAALVLFATPALAWEVPAEMLVSAKVRHEPLATARVVDTLEAGTKVSVLGCVPSGTWCKVRHPGKDGWVKAETFDRFATIHEKSCNPGSTALLCKLY